MPFTCGRWQHEAKLLGHESPPHMEPLLGGCAEPRG